MRIIRLVAAGVTLGALVYGGINLWHSDLLALDRVEVAGNSRVKKEQIVDSAGLSAGQHLMSIATDDVSGRVERIPWILTARVERIVPSTVRITVVEREPFVLVVAKGRSFLVSEDAVVLDEGGGNFLAVFDLPVDDLSPGDHIQADELDHLFGILGHLEPGIRSKIESVTAPSISKITLKLSDGLEILFGANEQVREKNDVVDALLEEASEAGRRLRSIDVRVPKRPSVREG